MCGFVCLIIVSLLTRAIGRAFNSKYTDFLFAIQKPKTVTKEFMTLIRQYDFEFSAWPVSFAMPATQRYGT